MATRYAKLAARCADSFRTFKIARPKADPVDFAGAFFIGWWEEQPSTTLLDEFVNGVKEQIAAADAPAAPAAKPASKKKAA
jgi:hypothetical protein